MNRTQQRTELHNQLNALMDRLKPGNLTTAELRRLAEVLADADDRIAGRKRTPARVLHLAPPAAEILNTAGEADAWGADNGS
jgi:hypothetical protein